MTRPLSVLFLSTRAPFPPTTGHFQRTYNILVRVAASADVHFFGFFDKGLSPSERERVRQELEKHCKSVYLETIPADESVIAKVLLGLRGLFSRKPVVALKYFRRSMLDALRRTIGSASIDIAHLDMLPLVEYEGALAGLATVLTNHNVESVRLERLAENQRNRLWSAYLGWQATKLQCYESGAVRQCSDLVVVSSADGDVLGRLNPECNIFDVPNGTDTGFYRLPENARPTRELQDTILWVGSAVDPYNRQAIDYFCDEVFPQVLEKLPRAVFRFVGKMPASLRNNLQERLCGNFDFQGFVDDVREHYAAAKVVCIPLLSGSGTKLKVIEALSMSRAVVTTSVGAEGLEVKDGTNITIRDGASALAAEVVALLRDDHRREEMEAQARTLAIQRYDWNQIGRLQLNAYNDILERGRN